MRTFGSLAIPNYRTYFLGLLISNIGGWAASTAKSWLVLVTLTRGNAVALGWLTGLMFLPALVFLPVASMIADRFPKRRIMMAMQTWMGVNSVILATLVLTGAVQLWHVFLLAFLDGTASALAQPAQQAFVAELVPRESLPNAISLNSASFNAARLLGPGIGGALIAAAGTGIVIAINSGAFVAFLVALALIDGRRTTPAPLQRGSGQVRAGLRYVRQRPDIMLLIFVAFMMGNFGFNFSISNALMATQAFGKGAGEYGALGSIMGVGALAAALWSARRARPRLRHILIALAVFAVGSAVSAVSPSYVFFAITLIPIGLAAILTMVTANSLVQMNVAPEFRGRVMALWGALLVGGTPFVSPAVGMLGNALGARATVWFEGFAILATVIVVTAYILKADHIRVRLDRTRSAPWVVLRRGAVTEDVTER